jgi:outer membrane biogenesis lipoprotein LolB
VNRRRFIFLVPLMFIQVACAAISKDAAPSVPADSGGSAADLLARVENANQTLVSTGGIGRITFSQSGKAQHLRIAWVSEMPDKLRIVLLGVDGRPLVTIAADGSSFYYVDHTTGEFRKETLRGHLLNAALQLPMDPGSLALLLAGRMPAFNYDRAELLPGRFPDETVIVLKKWWNRVGKVYVARSRQAISRVEAYRQTGEMRYCADIEETQDVAHYLVPRVLSIRDGATRHFRLDIERYRVNEPVRPGTFHLDPPEE